MVERQKDCCSYSAGVVEALLSLGRCGQAHRLRAGATGKVGTATVKKVARHCNVFFRFNKV